MKKEFVTYEIASVLKDLGFNEPCMNYYDYDKKLLRSLIEYPIINSKNGFHLKWNIIAAPLWQQVIEWFREKHGINIEIRFVDKLFTLYSFCIFKTFNEYVDCLIHDITIDDNDRIIYNSYNECREQAILKAIELIKK